MEALEDMVKDQNKVSSQGWLPIKVFIATNKSLYALDSTHFQAFRTRHARGFCRNRPFLACLA